jgi:hypothetical protein
MTRLQSMTKGSMSFWMAYPGSTIDDSTCCPWQQHTRHGRFSWSVAPWQRLLIHWVPICWECWRCWNIGLVRDHGWLRRQRYWLGRYRGLRWTNNWWHRYRWSRQVKFWHRQRVLCGGILRSNMRAIRSRRFRENFHRLRCVSAATKAQAHKNDNNENAKNNTRQIFGSFCCEKRVWNQIELSMSKPHGPKYPNPNTHSYPATQSLAHTFWIF